MADSWKHDRWLLKGEHYSKSAALVPLASRGWRICFSWHFWSKLTNLCLDIDTYLVKHQFTVRYLDLFKHFKTYCCCFLFHISPITYFTKHVRPKWQQPACFFGRTHPDLFAAPGFVQLCAVAQKLMETRCRTAVMLGEPKRLCVGILFGHTSI